MSCLRPRDLGRRTNSPSALLSQQFWKQHDMRHIIRKPYVRLASEQLTESGEHCRNMGLTVANPTPILTGLKASSVAYADDNVVAKQILLNNEYGYPLAVLATPLHAERAAIGLDREAQYSRPDSRE